MWYKTSTHLFSREGEKLYNRRRNADIFLNQHGHRVPVTKLSTPDNGLHYGFIINIICKQIQSNSTWAIFCGKLFKKRIFPTRKQRCAPYCRTRAEHYTLQNKSKYKLIHSQCSQSQIRWSNYLTWYLKIHDVHYCGYIVADFYCLFMINI